MGRMAAKFIKANDPTALLREAKRLAAEESQIQRRKLVLAKKLIEAGVALGGVVEEEAPAPRRKRRRKQPTRKLQPKVHRPSTHEPELPLRAKKDKPASWSVVIYNLIKEAESGVSYPDLKKAVSKTHLGPVLERTDKAFYGTLGKMTKKGLVVRHNGRFFTLAGLASFRVAVAAGVAEDLPPADSGNPRQKSPTRDAIMDYLAKHPNGAPISVLFDMLERQGSEFPDRNSRTIVYNLIARLIKRGVLTKDTKGIIRAAQIAARNDEAPHALAGRASH